MSPQWQKMVKLRIWGGGVPLGLSLRAVKIITSVIIRGRQWKIRQSYRGGDSHMKEKVI